MKIIALCGESDSGKTSALKLLMATFVNDEETKLLYCFYRQKFLQIIDPAAPAWLTPWGNVHNVTAVFLWHGKQIVVTTVGDAPSQIRSAVLRASERAGIDSSEIDAVVCACHPCMRVETFFSDVQSEDVVKIPKQSVILSGSEKISSADSEAAENLLRQLEKTVLRGSNS